MQFNNTVLDEQLHNHTSAGPATVGGHIQPQPPSNLQYNSYNQQYYNPHNSSIQNKPVVDRTLKKPSQTSQVKPTQATQQNEQYTQSLQNYSNMANLEGVNYHQNVQNSPVTVVPTPYISNSQVNYQVSPVSEWQGLIPQVSANVASTLPNYEQVMQSNVSLIRGGNIDIGPMQNTSPQINNTNLSDGIQNSTSNNIVTNPGSVTVHKVQKLQYYAAKKVEESYLERMQHSLSHKTVQGVSSVNMYNSLPSMDKNSSLPKFQNNSLPYISNNLQISGSQTFETNREHSNISGFGGNKVLNVQNMTSVTGIKTTSAGVTGTYPQSDTDIGLNNKPNTLVHSFDSSKIEQTSSVAGSHQLNPKNSELSPSQTNNQANISASAQNHQDELHKVTTQNMDPVQEGANTEEKPGKLPSAIGSSATPTVPTDDSASVNSQESQHFVVYQNNFATRSSVVTETQGGDKNVNLEKPHGTYHDIMPNNEKLVNYKNMDTCMAKDDISQTCEQGESKPVVKADGSVPQTFDFASPLPNANMDKTSSPVDSETAGSPTTSSLSTSLASQDDSIQNSNFPSPKSPEHSTSDEVTKIESNTLTKDINLPFEEGAPSISRNTPISHVSPIHSPVQMTYETVDNSTARSPVLETTETGVPQSNQAEVYVGTGVENVTSATVVAPQVPASSEINNSTVLQTSEVSSETQNAELSRESKGQSEEELQGSVKTPATLSVLSQNCLQTDNVSEVSNGDRKETTDTKIQESSVTNEFIGNSTVETEQSFSPSVKESDRAAPNVPSPTLSGTETKQNREIQEILSGGKELKETPAVTVESGHFVNAEGQGVLDGHMSYTLSTELTPTSESAVPQSPKGGMFIPECGLQPSPLEQAVSNYSHKDHMPEVDVDSYLTPDDILPVDSGKLEIDDIIPEGPVAQVQSTTEFLTPGIPSVLNVTSPMVNQAGVTMVGSNVVCGPQQPYLSPSGEAPVIQTPVVDPGLSRVPRMSPAVENPPQGLASSDHPSVTDTSTQGRVADQQPNSSMNPLYDYSSSQSDTIQPQGIQTLTGASTLQHQRLPQTVSGSPSSIESGARPKEIKKNRPNSLMGLSSMSLEPKPSVMPELSPPGHNSHDAINMQIAEQNRRALQMQDGKGLYTNQSPNQLTSSEADTYPPYQQIPQAQTLIDSNAVINGDFQGVNMPGIGQNEFNSGLGISNQVVMDADINPDDVMLQQNRVSEGPTRGMPFTQDYNTPAYTQPAGGVALPPTQGVFSMPAVQNDFMPQDTGADGIRQKRPTSLNIPHRSEESMESSEAYSPFRPQSLPFMPPGQAPSGIII